MKILRTISVIFLLSTLCLSAAAASHPSPLKSDAPNPFTLEASLSSTDGAQTEVGWSVAVSGDVIAAVEGGGSAIDLYIGSDGVWSSGTQTVQLTASDGNGFDAVAISGNTIVAGSEGADNIGATYVFVEPAGGWTNMTETAKLTAKGAVAGDRVGSSVAIAGNTIVSGAYENDSVSSRHPVTYPVGPGVAYIYEEPAGGWANMTQTAKIDASDGKNGDDFGYSVAIAGDTIAVGAPQSNSLEGAVYVFQKSGSHWKSGTETAKLTGSDNPLALGTAVSALGNTVASAAYSAVYLYIRPSTGWATATQSAELAGTGNNAQGLSSVALSEGYVLAGMPSLIAGPRALGFIKPSTGWINALPNDVFRVPPGTSPGEGYGWSVAIGGKTLVIGSPLRTGSGQSYVYVYGLD